MKKDQQIYAIRGFLETPGVISTFENVQEEAWQLVLFLRINNLVANDLLPQKKEEVTMDFKLMTSHLTDEGFRVLKEGLYKWLDKNDDINRTSIDMTPLEKALAKVRSDNQSLK